jgi:hypothetical protein
LKKLFRLKKIACNSHSLVLFRIMKSARVSISHVPLCWANRLPCRVKSKESRISGLQRTFWTPRHMKVTMIRGQREPLSQSEHIPRPPHSGLLIGDQRPCDMLLTLLTEFLSSYCPVHDICPSIFKFRGWHIFCGLSIREDSPFARLRSSCCSRNVIWDKDFSLPPGTSVQIFYAFLQVFSIWTYPSR